MIHIIFMMFPFIISHHNDEIMHYPYFGSDRALRARITRVADQSLKQVDIYLLVYYIFYFTLITSMIYELGCLFKY